MTPGICLVTGANGFLGRHLTDTLVARGWRVHGLVRDPSRSASGNPGVRMFEARLPDRIDEAAFAGVEVVVHCAYMSRHTTLTEARRVNEEGSARVLALTRRAGARFVFVSSTGAHEHSVSYYGRSKLAVESTLDLGRDLVIRPGLILGNGGLFQRISDSLARFGFIPVFDGGRQMIQTVHVQDLCDAMLEAIANGETGRYVVAEPEGIQLRDLFREMGRLMGRRCRLVPLPAAALIPLLRAAEAMGLRLPLTSENVLGVLSLRVQPSAGDLAALRVSVRDSRRSLMDLLSRS